MKKYLSLLFALMLVLTLMSCSNTENSSKNTQDSSTKGNDVNEIVIGTVGPYTGNIAEYGMKVKRGVELAIEEINKNGGISGKNVKLIAYDTEADATKATELVNRLIEQDGAKFILGPVITSECNAVSEILEENKVPMITPSGTGISITKGKDYVYRMCFTDNYQGVLMGKYAADELKVKTAAVIYNNASDYSIGLANAFKEKVESMGVKVTNFETYGKDDKDFSAIITNVKANNPEAVFLPDYYDVVSNIMSQSKKANFEPKFLGGDGWDGAAVEFAKEVEGGLFVSHYSTKDSSELAQKFTKAYKDKYNELPNSFAALAYDSAYVLKKAIEDANSLDSDEVIKALQNIEIDTVCSDKVKFDKEGDPLNKMAPVQIYKDGDVEFVTKIAGE